MPLLANSRPHSSPLNSISFIPSKWVNPT
jgi:hypothetical protein